MLALQFVALLLSATALAFPWSSKRSVPRGFVTTRGSQFELDGKPLVSIHLPVISHSSHIDDLGRHLLARTHMLSDTVDLACLLRLYF